MSSDAAAGERTGAGMAQCNGFQHHAAMPPEPAFDRENTEPWGAMRA